MRYKIEPLRRVDDNTLILGRNLHREVRATVSYNEKFKDPMWGNSVRRVRSSCVLIDTKTGQRRKLFNGYSDRRLRDCLIDVAMWLMITTEEAKVMSKRHTVNYT